MENWKKAVIAGTATAGAVLLLRRRSGAGIVLAGISVAALASEYPEKFNQLRRDLPNYVDRGTHFLDVVTRVGQRLADLSEGRLQYALDDFASM
jgi:hypothetical protein